MGKIKIISGGLLSSVQDAGRYAYQQFGMPVSGAMDTHSLQLANWLVGNTGFEACIEATYLGPEIEFLSEAVIGITGAHMTPQVNGESIFLSEAVMRITGARMTPQVNGEYVDMNATISVKKGDILAMGTAKKGMRAYISFCGGINVPEAMGSKSTYLRGKIGGFEGRKLADGDQISIGEKRELNSRIIPPNLIYSYPEMNVIRFIVGPEINSFEIEGISTFLNSVYKVSHQSDRMGYRLSGPLIKHKKSADIISSGIALGSIQVPDHGEPIVMMADHQTVGGYTKIANIISVDIPIMAQLKVGDQICFKEIQLKEAQNLLTIQNQHIKNLYNSK